jgi:diaminopimelate epimerase
MNIEFAKLSAAGNDFILIDNRKEIISSADYQNIAKKLCDRRYAVGADGLILIESSNTVDFKMKYFNSDGSHASMCGNGGRAIARFAYQIGAAKDDMVFETDAGIVKAKIVGENIVRLNLYAPKDLKQNIKLKIENKECVVDFINTGVPHAVLFVDDAENTEVFKYGKIIRNLPEFAPDGTNVNFVQKTKDNTIIVRTYERGVEDETLACGTGIIASSILSVLKGLVKSPVNIIARGGDKLRVSFNNENGKIDGVVLEGPAIIAFTGTTHLY